MIRSACDPVVAAHCQRSFQFAGLVARFETYVGNRGISLDIRGSGIERLSIADVANVLAVWPRAGFTDAFAQILIDEVRSNPTSTRLSWLESVAVASVPGFTSTDFLAALHASDGSSPLIPRVAWLSSDVSVRCGSGVAASDSMLAEVAVEGARRLWMMKMPSTVMSKFHQGATAA